MKKNSVEFEIRPERKQLVSDESRTIDVLVKCVPSELKEDADSRPRLNLSIVLDRSGSMGGEKIHEAREAAKFCVDNLSSSDRVGAVVFDDRVSELFESQLAVNKQDLKSRIDTVRCGGSTDLHEAWRRGGIQVGQNIDPAAINRVILVTDGQANIGVTDIGTIIAHTAGLAERRVSTTTIGIGRDFNEELLVPMAEAGRGNAWHVRHSRDMRRIFEVEMNGLAAQVATDVYLQITPRSGARVVEVLNDLEMDDSGRLKLPNLTAGCPLDIIVRLSVPACSSGTTMDIAEFVLSYTAQADSASEVVSSVYASSFEEEDVVMAEPADPRVERACRLLLNARLMREMNDRIDRGDRDGAHQVLACAARSTRGSYSAAPSKELAEELESLRRLEEMLEDDPVMARKAGRFAGFARRHGKERF